MWYIWNFEYIWTPNGDTPFELQWCSAAERSNVEYIKAVEQNRILLGIVAAVWGFGSVLAQITLKGILH